MLSSPMLYRDRLHPWCVIQLLSDAHTIIVNRFSRRNDAEAHMKAPWRMNPEATYEIMIDAQRENEEL